MNLHQTNFAVVYNMFNITSYISCMIYILCQLLMSRCNFTNAAVILNFDSKFKVLEDQ